MHKKSAALRCAAAVTAALLMVECGKNTGPGQDKGKTEVEVASFQGGYGIDFFQQAAKEYNTSHPGVRVTVWGDPRVWEKLRPRFIKGSPPDLTWPGWGMDYWPLVYEKQVIALDDALAGAPYGGGAGTWRDTFEPALLRMGQYEGKQYMLPYHYNVMGWWYDRKLFAQHGWQPPQTWSELLALCGKIKAAGIAPITYQGKYPDYAVTGFLLPWAVSIGGIKALDDAQNLTPGAWKSPAFVQAAGMIKELRDRGFFQDGANGMSHTEAQMEFLAKRAAMIPCGTWLHAEMVKVLPSPDTFDMQFMLTPRADNGAGDPTAVCIGIEPWVVPSAGKNRKQAIDFYKYMTSLPKAKQFVEEKGTLMAIRGSDRAKIPSYLQVPAKAFAASKTVWSVEFVQWYPTLATASRNAMASLLSGEATPEQFCRRMEDAAEQVRKDTTIPKHTVVR